MGNRASRVGLVLLLVLGIWRQPADTAISSIPSTTLYVLAIGISDYADDGIPDLQHGASDALDVAAALEEHGIQPNTKIKLMVNQQATKAAILQAVNQVAAVVRAEDTFVFYFGGQAFSPNLGEETSLLPHDAARRDLGTWIRVVELQAALDKVQAGRRLLLFDSHYLDIQARAKGTHVLQATGPGGAAAEGREHGGHFTAVLLQGLHGWADADQDMQVSVLELAGFVARQLPAFFDVAQIPSIRLYGPDFPLVGKSGKDSGFAAVSLPDKLDANLIDLIRVYAAAGMEGVQAYGVQHQVEIPDGRVDVIVNANSAGDLASLKDEVVRLGGSVQTEFENVLYATLPVAVLEEFVVQEAVWRVDWSRQVFVPARSGPSER